MINGLPNHSRVQTPNPTASMPTVTAVAKGRTTPGAAPVPVTDAGAEVDADADDGGIEAAVAVELAGIDPVLLVVSLLLLLLLSPLSPESPPLSSFATTTPPETPVSGDPALCTAWAFARYASSVLSLLLGGLITIAMPDWQCLPWLQYSQMGVVLFTVMENIISPFP